MKKAQTPQTDLGDLNFEEECKELIEALTEESQARQSEHNDPFDDYVERIRARSHQDPAQFLSRFVKGYQSLIQELRTKG